MKPQQQTLSIRISEALREYLERAKQVISNGRDEFLSISDVAKILLESAREDRLDHRFEVADLQKSPTESLCEIRQKWIMKQAFSRAEWIFLAQYIEVACERLSENPAMPTPEAFAVLLQALLAVRELRAERGAGLDRYYLGNLGVQDSAALNDRQLDPEIVGRVATKLIEDLRSTPNPTKPVFAGRNFYVALRDEVFPDMMALNRALDPFLPTLFRLAARGHWLQEKRPARIRWEGPTQSWPISTMKPRGFYLTASLAADGELTLSLLISDRAVIYPLGPYPQIREFAAMVDYLEPGRSWNGTNFYGSADAAALNKPGNYVFRRHSDGVQFTFSEDEWWPFRDVIFYGLADPRVQATLAELSIVYGEL